MNKLILLIILPGFFIACGPAARVVRVPDEYRSWKKTVDKILDYPIAGHGQSFRIIYINSIGEKVTPLEKDGRMTYDYPDGTIIVKEVYPSQEDLDKNVPGMLTCMVKDSQSPQAINGWLWIVKTPGDPAENVFTSKFCLECHLDANESHSLGAGNINEEFRDYVFFPYTSSAK
ncbi:MAG: cytochrome P460 family protein [Spirochaetales bacterium]|nr:cytochrome P460 family protein [Spirochaetales bacterium]